MTTLRNALLLTLILIAPLACSRAARIDTAPAATTAALIGLIFMSLCFPKKVFCFGPAYGRSLPHSDCQCGLPADESIWTESSIQCGTYVQAGRPQRLST